MRLEEFLTQNTDKKSFKKSEMIFSEGAQGHAAYYIISGKVEIFKGEAENKSSVATLGSGQIFGEMAILRFDEYTLSAQAAEDTIVHIITPAILQKELQAAHPLIRAILDMLADRIRETNEVLIDIDRLNRG